MYSYTPHGVDDSMPWCRSGQHALPPSGVLAPAPTPGDERGGGEAGDQAGNAEGQDPAEIHIAGIADTTQREEERADAKERSRHAQHAVDGNKHADMGGTGGASY